MTKLLSAQTSFNLGEVSPKLYGRVDWDKYQKGLEEATNCIVLPQGPVIRRNGTKFIKEVKSSTAGEVRLIPYIDTNETSYVLEFGNQYIRFYTLDSYVVTSGTTPYEVETPYLTADLQDLQYCQNGKQIYITHGTYEPRVLTFVSPANWLFTKLAAVPQPTYERGYIPNTTVTPAATTGTSVNFTAGANIFLAGDVGRRIINLTGKGKAFIKSLTNAAIVVCEIVEEFPSTSAISADNWKLDLSPIASDLTPSGSKLGATITLTSATNIWHSDLLTREGTYVYLNGGIVALTTYTSATSVSGYVIKTLNATSATGAWSLETPAWTTNNGYPKCCTFFEQRLVLAGTVGFPNRIWCSEVGLFDHLGRGPNADDALEFELSSQNTTKITWINSGVGLFIGTTADEHVIDSGGNGPITPTNVQASPRTKYGGLYEQTIKINDEVAFIQNTTRRIRSFIYDFNINGYRADDITFYCDHLTENGIKRVAYSKEPHSLIYGVINNGSLLAVAFDRSQNVLGASKFVTDGIFEDCVVIPYGETDEVWVVVKRSIDGNIKRYIEVFDVGDGLSDWDGFSDCYLTNNPNDPVGPDGNGGPVSAGYAITDLTYFGGGPVIGYQMKVTNAISDSILANDTHIVASNALSGRYKFIDLVAAPTSEAALLMTEYVRLVGLGTHDSGGTGYVIWTVYQYSESSPYVNTAGPLPILTSFVSGNIIKS